MIKRKIHEIIEKIIHEFFFLRKNKPRQKKCQALKKNDQHLDFKEQISYNLIIKS